MSAGRFRVGLPSLALPSLVLLFLAALSGPPPASGGPAPQAVLAEDFDALPGSAPADWRSVTFGRRTPTQYTVVEEDGRTALRAVSHRSASSLVWQREFDPRTLRKLSWEWKISGILAEGDETQNDREDLPARVMVLFPFEPERASLWERLAYQLLRLRYGDEPPGEALVYAWSNRAAPGTWHTSTHTERVSILALESGDALARRWVMAMRDIAADYEARFGRPVPSSARIAVMVDTDDTHANTVTWFDSFRLMPAQATAQAR
jgi:hypothetical protein